MAVFGAQLGRRFDNLFVVAPAYAQPYVSAWYHELLLDPHMHPGDLEALFGKAIAFPFDDFGYRFVENPEEYNGPAYNLRLIVQHSRVYEENIVYNQFSPAQSLAQAVSQRRRFLGWLQRRQMQLRVAKAEGV
jgi:hypothetical protein